MAIEYTKREQPWELDEIVMPDDANRWENGIGDCVDVINNPRTRFSVNYSDRAEILTSGAGNRIDLLNLTNNVTIEPKTPTGVRVEILSTLGNEIEVGNTTNGRNTPNAAFRQSISGAKQSFMIRQKIGGIAPRAGVMVYQPLNLNSTYNFTFSSGYIADTYRYYARDVSIVGLTDDDLQKLVEVPASGYKQLSYALPAGVGTVLYNWKMLPTSGGHYIKTSDDVIADKDYAAVWFKVEATGSNNNLYATLSLCQITQVGSFDATSIGVNPFVATSIDGNTFLQDKHVKFIPEKEGMYEIIMSPTKGLQACTVYQQHERPQDSIIANIPRMTSATAPSGTVSFTGTWSGTAAISSLLWGNTAENGGESSIGIGNANSAVSSTYTFATPITKGHKCFTGTISNNPTMPAYHSNPSITVIYVDGTEEIIYSNPSFQINGIGYSENISIDFYDYIGVAGIRFNSTKTGTTSYPIYVGGFQLTTKDIVNDGDLHFDGISVTQKDGNDWNNYDGCRIGFYEFAKGFTKQVSTNPFNFDGIGERLLTSWSNGANWYDISAKYDQGDHCIKKWVKQGGRTIRGSSNIVTTSLWVEMKDISYNPIVNPHRPSNAAPITINDGTQISNLTTTSFDVYASTIEYSPIWRVEGWGRN